MNFLFRIIGVVLGLMVSDALLAGIEMDGFGSMIAASIVLIFMNTIVRPVLNFFALPITILTLGFFLLVVNALTFWWTASLVDGFTVNSFGTAIIGAIITSLISSFTVKQKEKQ